LIGIGIERNEDMEIFGLTTEFALVHCFLL
jgi:hypothetical protein